MTVTTSTKMLGSLALDSMTAALMASGMMGFYVAFIGGKFGFDPDMQTSLGAFAGTMTVILGSITYIFWRMFSTIRQRKALRV
jgi:hypothetical protein